MPTSRAITSAVGRLSPVSITTSNPSFCNTRTVSAEDGLSASAIPMMPCTFSSTAIQITVLPKCSNLSIWSSRPWALSPNSFIHLWVPTRTNLPATWPCTPLPAIASNSLTSVIPTCCDRAYCTTASAKGCSEFCSTEAASCNRLSSLLWLVPSIVTKSVTVGLPWVKVPVLSRTMICNLWANSKLSAPLIKMPFSAPLPVPTRIDVGVANPNAQGQATMSTPTVVVSASVTLPMMLYQMIKVRIAIAITAGTNQPVTRSANFWIGAFEPWACCTNLTICARNVSFPIRVARNLKLPVLLIVAPMTSSPGCFFAAILSPVTIASSTVELPSITSPSTGIFSPGRTKMTSSSWTSAIDTSNSCPLRTMRAVFACNPISLRIASEVWPLARFSNKRPSKINVITTAAVS